MKSTLIVHIDDYGVTENYSQDVLKAIRHDVVDHVSILPNGYFTENAIRLLKPYKDKVKVSVHLNLVEGFPLANNGDLLLSSNGEFQVGFLKLIMFPIVKSRSKYSNLRRQIKNEFRLQIEKILNEWPEKKTVSIDSHRHIHLIPFVFDIVVELAEEYQLNKIRIIDESFYFCIYPIKNIKAYLNGNILKHFVIKYLSYLAKKKLIHLKKVHFYEKNEKFLGILFSDLMSVANIKKGLISLPGMRVRALFHSGVKLHGESYLGTNNAFLNYYESHTRMDEKIEILSDDFKELYLKTNARNGSIDEN